LFGVLAVLLVSCTYFFYTKPASASMKDEEAKVAALKLSNAALAARVSSYKAGSSEVSDAKARLAAAAKLLPVLQPGDLPEIQYMKLNLPSQLQSALALSGLSAVSIGAFDEYTPAGIPASLVAMTFEFSFQGSADQLYRAVEQLNDSGIPTTLVKTTLVKGTPSEAQAELCASSEMTVSSCLIQSVKLAVWYQRPTASSAVSSSTLPVTTTSTP
jgi:hypothetical protein